MTNVNVWIWKKTGKKRPGFVTEKFISPMEFKAWIVDEIAKLTTGQSISVELLPLMNENWEAFKVTYIEAKP